MARKPKKPRTARSSAGRRDRSAGRASEPSDGGLPSKDDILNFIAGAQERVGKREIARAFAIKGNARKELKALLAEMADEGLLTGNRKGLREKGGLPPVAVIDVTGRDSDGDLVARPNIWDDADGERPIIVVRESATGRGEALANISIGDKVLAHIAKLEEPSADGAGFEATPIKRLPRQKRRLIGIFRAHARGRGGTIEPVDRKSLRAWMVQDSDAGNAKDGDLVRFDLARKGRFSNPQAQVLESLGNPDDQRRISLIAVHAHGLPDDFPESVLTEAEGLPTPELASRSDLTQLPLVTIDPQDARDHDDAVYAAPDTDKKNAGGFVVIVAIADVAHYVLPGSSLDREARLRGNSVYFPDRVVPMLPETLSNNLCSLRELEDRPCLAIRMVFDARGEKRGQTLMRAVMRSVAKLSYQEAQAAIDGHPSEKCEPLMDTVLRPLWSAYGAMCKARAKREPLNLDLPERRILLDDQGRVARIVIPERLEAHRLIEEFMIQANVAAAELLEAKGKPVVYRVHDAPSKEKLKSLRDFLQTLDLKLPAQGSLKPAAFNHILKQAQELPLPDLVSEVVLRAQAQAEYNPANIGHFGLNLKRYAHFTSPIRRYADLLVHRGLIGAYGLGRGGAAADKKTRATASSNGQEKAQRPKSGDQDDLAKVCQAISDAERRAMAAERETIDRLIATHLADRVGAEFQATIAGVTRAGLFVRLKDTGADGFVPVSSLDDDFFIHAEGYHALIGQRSQRGYHLGDKVDVRLVEAIATAGALRFEMLTAPRHVDTKLLKSIRGLKGRRTGRTSGRNVGRGRRR